MILVLNTIQKTTQRGKITSANDVLKEDQNIFENFYKKEVK